MNKKQLKKFLIKLYDEDDVSKYKTINELRNAFIIYAFNENDLKEADSEYVESDNFEKFINKANTAEELRDLIKPKIKKNKSEVKHFMKFINGETVTMRNDEPMIIFPAKYGEDKQFRININTTLKYKNSEYRLRYLMYDEEVGREDNVETKKEYVWYNDANDEYREFGNFGNSIEDTIGEDIEFENIIAITD